MIGKLVNWLDDRTGSRNILSSVLDEPIPGGSRWRYVFGSMLAFAFAVQVITGIFLWMCYSPSARSAWESVFFIQFEIQGGWLLRGIHHFMAQAMIVLLALHLLQVVIDKAYKAPREINFWLGLVLLQIVLGLSLTGYLLPWDQKGFWATNVATNLMGLVPIVGDDLQKLAVGGPTYGHATLTRFFALHAGVLPAVLIGVLALHLALFRRHGVCAKGAEIRGPQNFWPHQAFKDGIACLAVLAVVLFFVLKGALFGDHSGEPAGAYLGAPLGAPADPAVPYSAARPEWYFLFLYQLLKYFQGEIEIVGAIILPGMAISLLFVMPFIGRWKIGHFLNVAALLFLGTGVLALTFLALEQDRTDPLHQEAVAEAQGHAERSIELARSSAGIPEAGAVSLLRKDPKTQGPVLFRRHCSGCHTHAPRDGSALDDSQTFIISRDSSAANLYQFGDKAWLDGLLDPERIAGPHYFGNTAFKKGDMVEFVQVELSDRETWTLEQIDLVKAALLMEAGHLPEGASLDQFEKQAAEGRAVIKDLERCAMCHTFHDQKENSDGPDLTGYASRAWMIDFISNPSAIRFYGKTNDRMPVFAQDPSKPFQNILSPEELSLLVSWLRREWYVPESP
ncbi:MAG: cytochrome b N-terminal domain-containing protein [Planctomycetota bacterium]|jgi:ubiquinol-cytochrome c reductase cytochrome b subunit